MAININLSTKMPRYDEASEAAIDLLVQSGYQSDDADTSGETVEGAVQSALMFAFMRAPRIMDHLHSLVPAVTVEEAPEKAWRVTAPNGRVFTTWPGDQNAMRAAQVKRAARFVGNPVAQEAICKLRQAYAHSDGSMPGEIFNDLAVVVSVGLWPGDEDGVYNDLVDDFVCEVGENESLFDHHAWNGYRTQI